MGLSEVLPDHHSTLYLTDVLLLFVCESSTKLKSKVLSECLILEFDMYEMNTALSGDHALQCDRKNAKVGTPLRIIPVILKREAAPGFPTQLELLYVVSCGLSTFVRRFIALGS